MVLPIIMAGLRAMKGIGAAAKGVGRGIKTGAQKVKQRFSRGDTTTVAAGGGFMSGLALRGTKGGATEDKQQLDKDSRKTLGSVFALFAIILWIIDLVNIPGLGGIYSGFNFNAEDFWTNWFSKFTFGNIWFDVGLTLIIIYIVVRYLGGEKPTGADIGSVSLFTLTMVFFAANLGWVAYPKAVLHFLFIILFGYVYVRQTNSSNAALITIVGLLFFDFFLFSTVFKLVPLFKYISLLGAIIIFWTFAQSPSGFTAFLFVSLVILIMILTVAEGLPSSGVFFEESDEGKAPISELMDRIGEGIGNYQRQVASTLEARINYAITGQVEENQYEPLGVYLENVQSTNARYYEDEDVIVWGTVKARTLDDSINIQIGCEVRKDKDNKIPADKIDPEREFQVFALEELDFACTFDGCEWKEDSDCESATLKKGSNTITTFADFNFETLAYLKMYFINNERKRAMIREGLDIFEEFDIKDKNPVTVYTNGPVAVRMGTSSSLVGVSSDTGSIANPRFTIDIENRPEWEGKITSLNELVLLVPNGVELKFFEEDDEGDVVKDEGGNDIAVSPCNREFEKYEDVCKDLCDGDDECKKDCDLSYVGYKLAQSEIDDFKGKDDERFKRFNCKITPDMAVLEDTPLTTKYFRVKVKYDYRVEEPITVKIDKCSTEVC